MARNVSIRQVAVERVERGELKSKDDGRPITAAEVEAVLGDVRRLTEGGIQGG